MNPELFLMIPGPTPVPQAVLSALALPPIGHRSTDFKATLKKVYPALKKIFGAENSEVLLYTASGTAAMEAALANTLNPEEEILVLSCGVFSHRWADIANTLGIKVHLWQVDAGLGHTPEALAEKLAAYTPGQLKAVCLIHNETSTGVMNPIEALAKVVRAQQPETLIMVDTVTGLGAAEFEFDAWDIDLAVSGSQKGFMLPPGLAFLAVSARAMTRHHQVCRPGFYFQFAKQLKSQHEFSTPYTPAVSLIRGLEVALAMLLEEGLPNTFKRHQRHQKMVRAAATALGLKLLVEEDSFASASVTSVLPPEGVSVDAIRAGLREQFNIVIANGQKELLGKIFRIGHLGAIFPRDVLMTLSALEVVLHQAGYKQTPLGTAVKAAQQVYLETHDYE
jgi:aspartate aminotransferase-like enzyme